MNVQLLRIPRLRIARRVDRTELQDQQCPLEVGDGLDVRRSLAGTFPCQQPVRNRSFASGARGEVMRHELGLAGCNPGELLLEDFGNAPMQILPRFLEHHVVRHFLNERVLET